MSRLKVGVIGLGVGEKHVEAFRAHPHCEVVALCDFSPVKLAEVGERHPGIRQTTNAADILDNPEIHVVSIASYDNFHHAQVTAALVNGKHVFVEKPLCLTGAELADIRAHLARRPDLKLSSNLILRKSPRFIELRRMIVEGALGDVYAIEGDYLYGRLAKITEGWRGEIDNYSVVHGGGIHLIDLMMWLLGDRIVEVAAFGNAVASRGSRFRYNDCVLALLKFAGGAIGKLSANFGSVHPHFHGLNIFGTRATFMNGIDHARLFTSRDPQVSPEKITSAYPGTHKGDLIGSFVGSIVAGTKADVTADDVLTTMSVSLAVEEAVRRGGVVSVSEFESFH